MLRYGGKSIAAGIVTEVMYGESQEPMHQSYNDVILINVTYIFVDSVMIEEEIGKNTK
jgi:hypothetical protein